MRIFQASEASPEKITSEARKGEAFSRKTKPKITRWLKVFDIVDILYKINWSVIFYGVSFIFIFVLWPLYEYNMYSEWYSNVYEVFYHNKELEHMKIMNMSTQTCPQLIGIIQGVSRLPNPEYDLITVQIYDLEMKTKIADPEYSVSYELKYKVNDKIMIWPWCEWYNNKISIKEPYTLNVQNISVDRELNNYHYKYWHKDPKYPDDELFVFITFLAMCAIHAFSIVAFIIYLSTRIYEILETITKIITRIFKKLYARRRIERALEFNA